MLACPSTTFHGPTTFHHHSQPSKFLLSKSKPLIFPPCSSFAAAFGKLKLCSLFSGKNCRRFDVKASIDSSESVDGGSSHIAPYSVKIPVGDRYVSFIHFASALCVSHCYIINDNGCKMLDNLDLYIRHLILFNSGRYILI